MSTATNVQKATDTPQDCWTIVNRMYDCGLFPSKISSIMLWGETPGTGKSSCFRYLRGNEGCELYQINSLTDMWAMLGFMSPKLDDEGRPTLGLLQGPAYRCLTEGKLLILDEIDNMGEDFRPCLNALTECDPSQIRLQCADGSYVTAAPGYGVVATSNYSPEKLHESVRSRFLAIHVDRPAPGILASFRPGLQEFFANHFGRMTVARNPTPPITPRLGILAQPFLDHGFTPEETARVVCGTEDQGLIDSFALALSVN